MKTFFDKLNLRPHERRLVVIVALLLFVLINWWFVWPFFGQWSKTTDQIKKDRDTLARYKSEIAKKAQYETQLQTLEKTGSQMLTDDLQLQRLVQNTAAVSGLQNVNIDARTRAINTSTNQFFQEQTLSLTFTSGGKELVEFLVNLASENSMIRVRQMNLKAEPANAPTRLSAHLEMVGNYQKKPSQDKPAAPPRRRT